MRLEPRDETLAPVEAGWLNGPGLCGTYSSQVERNWLYQALGELPLGRQTLVLDLSLERGRPFRSRFTEADEGFVLLRVSSSAAPSRSTRDRCDRGRGRATALLVRAECRGAPDPQPCV